MIHVCGVAGVFFASVNRRDEYLRNALIVQENRGPDSNAISVGSWWGLGHNRLAINALGSDGEQPLKSRSGRWLVIFNGEIYNHQDIRDTNDWNDVGPSDGQVIPELLDAFGPVGLQLLRGMFAICAVDLLESNVLVAVDPFGIKPLYWTRDGALLKVASEIKAIFCSQSDFGIDREAIATYLHRGALDNSRSGVKGIERVQPGTWTLLNDKGVCDTGSTFISGSDSGELSDWETAAASLFESVQMHLMSDVPVSLLMSDGVDSGAIAVALAEHGHDVTAITVDVGGGFRSESGGAARICHQLGIEHHVLRKQPDDDSVSSFFEAMQRPTIDGLNTFMVCGAVKEQGFKVALSGTGGDEFLTAYQNRRKMQVSRALSHLPAKLSAHVLAALLPHQSAHELHARLASMPGGRVPSDPSGLVSLQRQIWPNQQVERLLGTSPRPWTPNAFMQEWAGSSIANQASSAQVGLYLTSQLLPDADAFSMAHSVELRVPFVDTFLARSILGIQKRKLEKMSLVDALGNVNLKVSSRRPKQGFSVPIAEWMQRGMLKHYVSDLGSSGAPIRAHLDSQLLDESLGAWRAGTEKWPRIWSLVALNEWLRRTPAT